MTMASRKKSTVPDIEKTAWAIEFKADSPVSYAQAIRFAQQDRLEVFVEQSDPVDTGAARWVVRVLDLPDFLMEVKSTKTEALRVCKEMGWRVVR